MSESRDQVESAVLGSLIQNPARVLAITSRHGIDAEWFRKQEHRAVWFAIDGMKSDPLRIDLLSVCLSVRSSVRDEVVESIYESCSTDAHAEYYVEMLRKYWMRDRLHAITATAAEQAKDESENPEIVAAKLQTHLGTLAPPEGKRSIPQVYDSLLERWTGSGEASSLAVPSRFPMLQKKLGGYRHGKVYILAARPANGKTTLACNEARSMAESGKRVSIASLEMDEEEVRGRILCEDCDLSQFSMDTGQGTQFHFERINAALPKHRGLPIRVCDESMSVSRFCGWATNEVITHKAEVIILDYLQILMPDAKGKGSRNDEITSMMNHIRATAKRLHVPFLILCQLSRANESEGRRPRLSDLRDSGSIEQDAYAVLFIHREKITDENCEWIIAKNRGGPVGLWEMTFEGNRQRFSEKPRASENARLPHANA